MTAQRKKLFRKYSLKSYSVHTSCHAAVAILEFEGTWNDFFWPLVIFNTAPSHYTLPVGIFSFVSTYQTNYPPLMASSVIAIAPIAFLYVFFQRFFVAGVASSGVKG